MVDLEDRYCHLSAGAAMDLRQWADKSPSLSETPALPDSHRADLIRNVRRGGPPPYQTGVRHLTSTASLLVRSGADV